MPALSVVDDIFTAKPGRWHAVARIVAASALAELVTLMLLEDTTFWPILTVLILSAKNVGVTWQKSFHRAVGTLVGFFLAISIVAVFPQTPGALLFSFIPVFIVCIYLSQTDATNQYAFFMVVVTMTVVISPAWENPELVAGRGLDRFMETIIGILSVTFISRCVLPVTAESELKKAMKGSLDRAFKRFELVIEILNGAGGDAAHIEPESRTSFTEKVDLLNAAISESTHVHDNRGEWMARINLSNRLAVQSEMLLDQLTPEELARIPDDFKLKMIDCVEIIRKAWKKAGIELLDGGLPDVNRESMNAIADQLESGRSHDQKVVRVNAVTTVIMMVRQVGELREIMGYQEHVKNQSLRAQISLIRSAKHRIENLDLNMLKLAVKATLSTMLALLLVATLRWTDAMLTTAITAIIVIQPTMGASWSKSTQRIIGAVIGCIYGIAGLAIISANTNDLTWMLLYLSVGIGVAAWLMSGSWETSYVGLQIGLAVALVLGVTGPTSDIETGLGRVAGILFGLCIALTVLRFLWPVWAGTQVCSAMGTACRSMAKYLEVGLRNPEEEQAVRPPGGWNYQVLTNISHAYKYREEARYERGLTRTNAAPGLNMGVRLQSLLPKVILIVEARQLRSLREDIVTHPVVSNLRNGMERRLNLIADLAEGGDGEPEPLQPLVDAAYDATNSNQLPTQATNLMLIKEFLGYYNDMIPELDSLVEDARQLASLFSESKGISRLASSVS
ncbi:MAG: FUSC family protein [Phycisphaerales bacterium]|nr:FUSC family protein [Phycisphaerales bacterium]